MGGGGGGGGGDQAQIFPTDLECPMMYSFLGHDLPYIGPMRYVCTYLLYICLISIAIRDYQGRIQGVRELTPSEDFFIENSYGPALSRILPP